MAEVIGVRFNGGGKIYYFDPDTTVFTKGQRVIVETSKGVECAEVVMENKIIDDDNVVKPLKKIMRLATQNDINKLAENKKKEKEAFEICQQKIAAHKLDMKLTNVEYAFDDSKILFYFTADGRVDFRELVKDLAAAFRNRIELRQIGVRDEAKMLGGVGICGQPLCCSRFLDEFQPVSIKMAKEQNLSPNPLKISGSCGRLMCCLKYEHDTYEQLIRETPSVGSVVNTPEGRGVIAEANILTGNLKVRLDKYPEALPKTFNLKEINVISRAGNSSNKRRLSEDPAKEETDDN